MRGPDADASRTAFEVWLAASAAHRSAYNRAAEVFAMGKLLSRPEAEAEAEAGAEPTPVVCWPVKRLAAVMTAFLLIAATAWLGIRFAISIPPFESPPVSTGPPEPYAVQLSAAPGAARSVRLADGSRVTLAGGTIIDVRMDSRGRLLRLLRGEGRFEVSHDGRPFVVDAGGGSVTARGTIFNVRLAEDSTVRVRLLEGAVDVRFAPGQPGAPASVRRMAPGEALTFPAISGSAHTASEATGGREFVSVPLGRLLAVVNRNSVRPIRTESADLDALRVSGRFAVDDSALLAERLAALFDLEVDNGDSAKIMLRKR